MLRGLHQNKKGWIRIVEAFIAILLITGVLLFLYERNVRAPVEAEEIYKLQNTLLSEVGSGTDLALRGYVLDDNDEGLKNLRAFFDQGRIPPGFDYEIKICVIENICGPPSDNEALKAAISEGKEIYSTERIISATIGVAEFEPKKLKLFMWRK